MHFIHEWGFDVKEGKSQALQRWLTDNEEKFALEMPQGCEYVGTFAVVHTSEKGTGQFRMVMKLDSYGAQDNFSAAMKDGGTFAGLMEELTAFMDESNNANWSEAVMRRVTDTAMWGE
jgi:hypothetical protein